MLPINKNTTPPTGLIALQTTPLSLNPAVSGEDKYNQLTGNLKKSVQAAVLEEQGHICCYCMKRVTAPINEHIRGIGSRLTLEHFRPKTLYSGGANGNPNLTLTYTNLLGACKGQNPRHCDQTKGGAPLLHIPNPATTAAPAFFAALQLRYDDTGLIASNDSNIHNELDGASTAATTIAFLNLNDPTLQTARKTTWKNIIDLKINVWVGLTRVGSMSQADYKAKIEDLHRSYVNAAPLRRPHKEYCGYVVYMLEHHPYSKIFIDPINKIYP